MRGRDDVIANRVAWKVAGGGVIVVVNIVENPSFDYEHWGKSLVGVGNVEGGAFVCVKKCSTKVA